MRNVRLNPLIISIIGIVLCITSPLLIWYLMIQPVQQRIAVQEAALQPVAQYVGVPNPPDLIAANAALVANQAKAAVIRAQWATLQRTKNPLIQSADKWRAWYQWIGFLEFEFAQDINNFLLKSPAQPLTFVSAPAPPNSPNDVPQGIVQMPLNSISVFGSYNQILQQVESWNNFHRIVSVDGLSLQGYSPFMTGTYTATEYIYTESASGLPSTAPGGGAASAATLLGGTGLGSAATTAAAGGVRGPEGAQGSYPGAPGGFSGAPGGFQGAPGQLGGQSAGAALPPPPSVPANFEDTPEYKVHIHSLQGTITPQGVNGGPQGFGGGGPQGFNPGARGFGGRFRR